ncbi:hypothetical protein SLEP1_g18000 [Rubroshorea leprosula]|uniref:Uncharacterized protein n=1 Tax=Rubroshorea leprosula TaxID=152421 RepID=A0AAV5J6M6_9ROSI|nr:hypothetical protein SLEP1_g18000 [Rubroshorea leprosula]
MLLVLTSVRSRFLVGLTTQAVSSIFIIFRALVWLGTVSMALGFCCYKSTWIPSGLGKLVNLRHLNLSNSEFSGQIPVEISGLTRLVSLDFSIWSLHVLRLENPYYVLKLEDPNLSMLVRNLMRLAELHLQGVDLSAEGHNWGRALSSLPRLRVLNLADCLLSGPIDSSLAELRSLSVIRLGRNNISAPVPEFLGPIPSSLGNLQNLESLDLSSNTLTGNIPQQLGGLNFLEVLNLSHNQLEGRIPKGNQLQTFSEDFFKDNKGLCNCTKPEVLLQSASALRDDLQSPEVKLGADTPMLKSAIIGATFRAEIERA